MRLHAGLQLSSFAPGGRKIDEELDLLVRRLARHGLLEYRLRRSPNGADQVIIEPQVADYWPRTPPLSDADVLVLSRFAYMRRRGNEMVLESPRAGALFKICDPKLAAAIALLSTPRKIKRLGGRALARRSFSRCWSIVKSSSKSMRAAAASGPTRAMTIWFFGTFTISCSTPAARKADTPTCSAEFFLMSAPYRRYRRCGPRWPGKKIDLRKFSAVATANNNAIRKTPAANGIRPEALMISDQSRSPSSRGFSTGRHAWCRNLKPASTSLGRAVHRSRMLRGPYPSPAAATNSNSIWLSTNARGLLAASITTMPAPPALVRIAVTASAARRAADARQVRHGCARSATDCDHDCGALRPHLMEVQLDRLRAHPQGCRRIDADVLSDGD